jgi:histidine triad (HIT) family protein
LRRLFGVPDCLFCRIVAGELPATLIDESERALAFLDISPATRGHSLVVPRVHSRDLEDITAEDLAACAALAQRVARTARARLSGVEGVNLLQCSGATAWQTVFHFHLHVIPRYGVDPLRAPWVPAPGDAVDLASVAAELTGARRP